MNMNVLWDFLDAQKGRGAQIVVHLKVWQLKIVDVKLQASLYFKKEDRDMGWSNVVHVSLNGHVNQGL